MQESKSSYKIYSRSRFNIFKGNKRRNINKQPRERRNKAIYFCIIILVAIFIFNILSKSVAPIFETLCEEKAHEIATIATNEESTKVMANYEYGDLFNVEKDESREYKNDCCQYFYNK